jgi:GH15 family glucan-1,4-alpha-glucosidase
MASRIEDYGLIGNTRTSALVSRSGSIDWLCAPRFDSDACFAALLGYDEHGRWAVRPTVPMRESRQRYRGDTMILETDLICDGGAVRLTDFMPAGQAGQPGSDRCDVVRIIEGLDGEVPVEMLMDVRFGYGHDKPWVTPAPDGVRFTAGPDTVLLRGPVLFGIAGSRVSAYLQVRKGDRVPLQLNWHPSHEDDPARLDADQTVASTDGFWRQWAARCTYEGPWRDLVLRSLITLKALIYAPTGGIVAAPTTSLPEEIGGVRNWDYRFCWMRDASLTLDALMIGGYVDEARAFRDWVLRAAAGSPADMQIMYDLSGGRRLTEFDLPWLPGYEGSRPVRVGNAASGQFQLDVYGELFSTLFAGRKMGLAAHDEGWPPVREMIQFLEDAWQREDDGIWEVRGGRRHFTHSKIMAWVAIDRAARTIDELGMGGDEGRAMLPHLRALRERLHAEVCDRGYNPRVGAFTQSYGSAALDASVLLMPHFGFLPGTDPRVRGTVAAIEKHLLRDGFVLRYDTADGADGLPGSEGAFLACSFWLADNYAFAGRIAEAEQLFDRLIGLRNHLGLLSEEYDPRLQRQIGNFPQAFSHLALVYTARLIDAVRRHQEVRVPLRGEGMQVETVH